MKILHVSEKDKDTHTTCTNLFANGVASVRTSDGNFPSNGPLQHEEIDVATFNITFCNILKYLMKYLLTNIRSYKILKKIHHNTRPTI